MMLMEFLMNAFREFQIHRVPGTSTITLLSTKAGQRNNSSMYISSITIGTLPDVSKFYLETLDCIQRKARMLMGMGRKCPHRPPAG